MESDDLTPRPGMDVMAGCARCQAIEERTEEQIEAIYHVEPATSESNIREMRLYGLLLLCNQCQRSDELFWKGNILADDLVEHHAVVLEELSSELRYHQGRYKVMPEDLLKGYARTKSKLHAFRKARDFLRNVRREVGDSDGSE